MRNKVRGARLPFSLGTDARTGRKLVLRYFCSDLCPDNGQVLLRYEELPDSNVRDSNILTMPGSAELHTRRIADCCQLGGLPTRDYAWGGYVGCAPPEQHWSFTHRCSKEPRRPRLPINLFAHLR